MVWSVQYQLFKLPVTIYKMPQEDTTVCNACLSFIDDGRAGMEDTTVAINK
jgi:hypothetical protein